MRNPARFRAETKYAKTTEEKANVNLPIMAVVGDRAGAGAVVAVPNKNNFYWVRLLGDPNRVTQCFCQTFTLVAHDVIYVAKARDRNLSWYEFVSFIQATGGGTSPVLSARGIIIPDNLAQGFYIEDDDSVGAGTPEYLRIVTTDGGQAVEFNFGDADVDFIVNANAIPDALQLLGSDGIIRSGAGILLVGGVIDVNGIADAIVLDTDGNTTISAPTNDQIDFEIGGADDFTMTANAFNVLAGSAIVMADGTTVGQAAGPLLTFDDTLNYLEITGCYVGIGTTTPATLTELEETQTLAGDLADGYAACLTLDPGYTAGVARTVTRHNYIDVENVSTAGGAAVTNAAVFRFNAAIGTHKCLPAAFQTTDSGADTTNWAGGLHININGTLYKIPYIAV